MKKNWEEQYWKYMAKENFEEAIPLNLAQTHENKQLIS